MKHYAKKLHRIRPPAPPGGIARGPVRTPSQRLKRSDTVRHAFGKLRRIGKGGY